MRNPAEEYDLARRLPIPELVKVMQGQSDAVSLAVAHAALKEKTDAQKAQQGIAASQFAMAPKVKEKDIQEAMGIGSLPIRAQAGLFVDPYGGFETSEETEEERRRREEQEELRKRFPEQFKELEKYRPNLLQRTIGFSGQETLVPRLKALGYTDQQIEEMPIEQKRFVVERSGITGTAPIEPKKEIKVTRPGEAAPSAPAAPAAAPAAASAARQGIGSIKMVEDILKKEAPAFDMKKAVTNLGEQLPDTVSGKIEEMIKRREESLKGKREENKGMALLEAGLAGLAAGDVKKGLMYGLRAYKEGLNDIRKGEDFIESARIDMAKSKDARDRGLMDLAIKLQGNAEDKFIKGKQLELQGADIVSKSEYYATAGQRKEKEPSTTTKASEREAVRKEAEELLKGEVFSGRLQPNSPEYFAALERLKQQIFAREGKIYTPISVGGVSSDGPVATYTR